LLLVEVDKFTLLLFEEGNQAMAVLLLGMEAAAPKRIRQPFHFPVVFRARQQQMYIYIIIKLLHRIIFDVCLIQGYQENIPEVQWLSRRLAHLFCQGQNCHQNNYLYL